MTVSAGRRASGGDLGRDAVSRIVGPQYDFTTDDGAATRGSYDIPDTGRAPQ
jgi:hypothetical protein